MNNWISFVKDFQKQNNLSYSDAMKIGKYYYRRDEEDEKIGTGITSAFKRIQGKFDYTTSAQNIINKHGNQYISGIEVRRAPVSVSAVVNLAKKVNKTLASNLNKKPYDELYHLFMVVSLNNGKRLIVEKNEVINIALYNGVVQKNEESIKITLKTNGLSFNSLLTNTENEMQGKYFTYSAFTNNCQDFITAILKSNNISTTKAINFIKQDVKHLVSSASKSILKGTTDIAGVISTVFD